MITRLLAIAGWLTTGHLVLFGLYWLLLTTPESNVVMLAVSALNVIVMALVFGWVEAVGLAAWQSDARPRDLVRRAIGKVPAVWLAAALLVVIWYLVSQLHMRWVHYEGEIDAWLMARFGWADTDRLHTAFRWLLSLARFLGLSLALSLASGVTTGGFGALKSAAWIRGAFSPRRLLTLAGILLVFVWLPWRGVNWRPSWLSPNWQETAFVAAKLAAIFVLANVGWALVLGVGRSGGSSPSSVTDSQ